MSFLTSVSAKKRQDSIKGEGIASSGKKKDLKLLDIDSSVSEIDRRLLTIENNYSRTPSPCFDKSESLIMKPKFHTPKARDTARLLQPQLFDMKHEHSRMNTNNELNYSSNSNQNMRSPTTMKRFQKVHFKNRYIFRRFAKYFPN